MKIYIKKFQKGFNQCGHEIRKTLKADKNVLVIYLLRQCLVPENLREKTEKSEGK